jgi:aminoacylase
MPDEEIGGQDGMGTFVETQAFKNLDVGFALDESIPSETEDLVIFHNERTNAAVTAIVTGNPGSVDSSITDFIYR